VDDDIGKFGLSRVMMVMTTPTDMDSDDEEPYTGFPANPADDDDSEAFHVKNGPAYALAAIAQSTKLIYA